MLTKEQINTLPTHLRWVEDLQIGQELEVKDNSYCFDITNNQRIMTSLMVSIHNSKETGYGLIIEDIFLKGWQGYFSRKVQVYPTVRLKSKYSGHKYEVAICWGKPW